MTVWERRLLRRLDDAVVTVLNRRIGKKTKPDERAIPVTQPDRIKEGLRARIAQQKERRSK